VSSSQRSHHRPPATIGRRACLSTAPLPPMPNLSFGRDPVQISRAVPNCYYTVVEDRMCNCTCPSYDEVRARVCSPEPAKTDVRQVRVQGTDRAFAVRIAKIATVLKLGRLAPRTPGCHTARIHHRPLYLGSGQ